MRLSILILSLAVPAAAAAAPPAALPKPEGKECPADRARFADGRPKAEIKRLGELPPERSICRWIARSTAAASR